MYQHHLEYLHNCFRKKHKYLIANYKRYEEKDTTVWDGSQLDPKEAAPKKEDPVEPPQKRQKVDDAKDTQPGQPEGATQIQDKVPSDTQSIKGSKAKAKKPTQPMNSKIAKMTPYEALQELYNVRCSIVTQQEYLDDLHENYLQLQQRIGYVFEDPYKPVQENQNNN